ncbi:MAG: N-acetylglucosamine-6-phosphate deacetylase [Clostridia bacterium]|nr:N-acetylglucosamine-6-phosphate deacetylase [Clostridia bacterium]
MIIKNGIAFIDGAFHNLDIRIQNGRITETGMLEPVPGEVCEDILGHYLLPGFVDIHIHAFGGADCMRGEADVRKMSRELLKTGVAAFAPTTMSAWPEDTYHALAGIDSVRKMPEANGAAVLGAHMEAPFLAPKFKGAQLGECLQAPSVLAYEAIIRDIDCVRLMTIAPELEGALDVIRYLHERGIVTCAAHSGAKAADVHAAADAGLTQITHLFNAQTPLHHREPGVPGAGLADDRIAVQIIADGIHVHPDVLRITGLCKGATGTILISDSMEAAGLPDGEYKLGGQKVIVADGAARLENGVLAGSTLKLHDAVRNMIHLAGLKPETVIPMATSTPADSIGAVEYGRIGIGNCGILAEMDSEWNFVKAVYEK